MKRRLIVGNWKMNLGCAQACSLAKSLIPLAHEAQLTEIWIAPSYLTLSSIGDCLKNTKIKLGAQNVHWERFGAFTGEVSAPMLKEIGCTFVIVGHSERRRILHETEEEAGKRAVASIREDLTVIFCVGEILSEREEGNTKEVLETQLKHLCELLQIGEAEKLIIAYEPVWAIGTGKAASVAEIARTLADIQKLWSKMSKEPCPSLLYGGSVSGANFEEILKISLVSGALVGGASQKLESFQDLVNISEAMN